MEANYLALMQLSFKNDITQTSEKFIKVIVKEGGCLKFGEKIKKYFIALNMSEFARNLELHEHIYTVLDSKENRFDLYSILSSEEELKDMATFYGKFLLTNYQANSKNTDTENKILIAIAEAIETKRNDSEPEPQE